MKKIICILSFFIIGVMVDSAPVDSRQKEEQWNLVLIQNLQFFSRENYNTTTSERKDLVEEQLHEQVKVWASAHPDLIFQKAQHEEIDIEDVMNKLTEILKNGDMPREMLSTISVRDAHEIRTTMPSYISNQKKKTSQVGEKGNTFKRVFQQLKQKLSR